MLSILTRKAQSWYIDFIFGVVVFSLCIILFYKFVPNLSQQELSSLNEVYQDCKLLSESVSSSGYPENWTNDSVQRIGITDRGIIINGSKVAKFDEMTKEDYSRVKNIFSLKADFVLFFTNSSDEPVSINGVYYIGYPDVSLSADNRINMSAIDYDNLASLTRVLIYNKKTIKMVTYAWD